MWFSAADLTVDGGLHTLHETTSLDGLTWACASEALLDHAYAPTILLEDGVYRLWYTDVEQEPWCIRYAESGKGCDWKVAVHPVLVIDQPLVSAEALLAEAVGDATYLHVEIAGSSAT